MSSLPPPGPAAGASAARRTSSSPLREALLAQRPLFTRAAFFSLVSGVLVLAPTLYMLEVYDRVVNSRSVTTLAMLTLAVVGIYAVMEALELVRSRLLHAAGERVDAALADRLFDVAFEANLKRVPGGTMQAFTDLRTIRDFLPSPAVGAVLDAPAALLMLVLVFLISPQMGAFALVGAIAQVIIAVMTERRTMPPLTQANRSAIEAQGYATGALRNAQVIHAMGMMRDVLARWSARQQRFLRLQSVASDAAGFNSAAAKLIQMLQGSVLLGLGCWLELHGMLPGGGGMMIVASTLGGRVLAPLAQLVAQWRLVVNVRDAAQRLDTLLGHFPQRDPGMPLPAPRGVLTCENVVAAAPGSPMPILRGVSFGLQPGEVLGVIGPSASGKTSLARLLVGLWPTASGKVRLDGADVHGWFKGELGPHLGYLPQTVELFDGTIAENIARFGDVDPERVRVAAELVGLGDFVGALPDGYDTRIGDEGGFLSGGQRQRVGLARAIYGDPKLVVLDEPNASLDEAGEQALVRMLRALAARGAAVVVITHRMGVLPALDKLLVLRDGQVAAQGPRDDVLAALQKAQAQAAQQAQQAQAAQQAARAAAPVRPAGAAA